jgi:outer membrane protein TolC
VATRQLVAADEQALQTYEGLLRLAKVKLAAGQVTQLDVVEASAKVNEARNQLLYLQGLLSEEQRNLEVLIGGYPAAAVEVSQEFVPLRHRSRPTCRPRCSNAGLTSSPPNPRCWWRSARLRLRDWLGGSFDATRQSRW